MPKVRISAEARRAYLQRARERRQEARQTPDSSLPAVRPGARLRSADEALEALVATRGRLIEKARKVARQLAPSHSEGISAMQVVDEMIRLDQLTEQEQQLDRRWTGQIFRSSEWVCVGFVELSDESRNVHRAPRRCWRLPPVSA